MSRLILVATDEEMCGMKNLALTLKPDKIWKLTYNNPIYRLFPIFDLFAVSLFGSVVNKQYDEVITMLYPMHLFGHYFKDCKWICYDNKIPPPRLFKGFFKRMYIRLFTLLNNWSKEGADEYWDIAKIKQKPFFEGKKYPPWVMDGKASLIKPYALYLGRTEDYKNYKWLKATMEKLGIPLKHPANKSDMIIYYYLKNAALFITASTWEGYGRGVMEAQARKIPTVCFDTGTHKENMKKGFVVNNGDFDEFRKKIKEAWIKYAD